MIFQILDWIGSQRGTLLKSSVAAFGASTVLSRRFGDELAVLEALDQHFNAVRTSCLNLRTPHEVRPWLRQVFWKIMKFCFSHQSWSDGSCRRVLENGFTNAMMLGILFQVGLAICKHGITFLNVHIKTLVSVRVFPALLAHFLMLL